MPSPCRFFAPRACGRALLRQDGVMTYRHYSKPLPEMGLADVIRDLRGRCRPARLLYLPAVPMPSLDI